MKRQKRKPARPSKPKQPENVKFDPGSPDDPDRRSFLSRAGNGIALGAAIGGGGWYMVHSFQATAREHDLSRIGNGVPTIVQIHDPNCSRCVALQRETRDAVCEIGEDKLQYLVANIQKAEGQQLATTHGVGNVTLLLFDGQGRRRDILSGNYDSLYLGEVFREHLARSGG